MNTSGWAVLLARAFCEHGVTGPSGAGETWCNRGTDEQAGGMLAVVAEKFAGAKTDVSSIPLS